VLFGLARAAELERRAGIIGRKAEAMQHRLAQRHGNRAVRGLLALLARSPRGRSLVALARDSHARA
jgi:hypothetical protein